MTPEQIVAAIKERPAPIGVALLLQLFPNSFTVVKSAIDPTQPPAQIEPAPPRDRRPDWVVNPSTLACPRCDTPTNGETAHPVDDVKHTHDPFAGMKRTKVSRDQDPAGQGRSYEILTPRKGTGRLQIDGRDATPEEIESATDQLNREAAQQLRDMATGNYTWLERDVAPDITHSKPPKGG